MTVLTKWAYAAAALVVLFLLLVIQELRVRSAQEATKTQAALTAKAEDTLATQKTTINTLTTALGDQHRAQQALLATQSQLGQLAATRKLKGEVAKRENPELREWADRPLPDSARGLLERPAITGADQYRDWLSRGGTVQPAAGGAAK